MGDVPSTAMMAAMKLISEPSCSAAVSIPISWRIRLADEQRRNHMQECTYTLVEESLNDVL